MKTLVIALAVTISAATFCAAAGTAKKFAAAKVERPAKKKQAAPLKAKPVPKKSAPKKRADAKKQPQPKTAAPKGPAIVDLGVSEFGRIKLYPKPKLPKLVSLSGKADGSQAKQNAEIDREHLTRFKTNKDVAAAVKSKLLVPLPKGKGLAIAPDLDPSRRYTRPWTRMFLLDTAELSRQRFPKSVWQINSAVRSIAFHNQMAKTNANAAKQSSHVAGPTVDIAKTGHSLFEIEWMRKRLLTLERLGLAEATEEFFKPVFHVMVYEYYPSFKPRT